jgi:hypothetical protein
MASPVVTTDSAIAPAVVELSGRRLLLQSLLAAGNSSASARHKRPLQYGCVAGLKEIDGFYLAHCFGNGTWVGSKEMMVTR